VARRATTRSILCVGLDPELDRLPEGISRDVAGVTQFVSSIIEATADQAGAFKPNLAFYEALGPEGIPALQYLLRQIPGGIPIIADAKRSDIGNSARLYAAAVFDVLHCDAIIVNPYQGSDSVEAYMTRPDRGVYVLARTSNPGSADFQELLVEGEPLYRHIVRRALRWKRSGTLGFVVGATAPDQIKAVREDAPDAPLLIPGIGVQGGDVQASIRFGRRSDGGGLLLSASRSILYASSRADFADAARAEAQRLVDRMRSAAAEVAA